MSFPGDGPDDSDGDDGAGRRSSSDSSVPGTESSDDEVAATRPDRWHSEKSGGPPPTRAGERDEATSEWQLFAYDLVSSVVAVMVIGAYLFAVSGVWPPLVAVESESMVPNMEVNDLVFVMDEERFPGENAHAETGVVTAQGDTDYRKFGQQGDVIVFAPDGNSDRTPIIHRAMFWVEEGENWYDRADPDYVGGADACEADRDPSSDTGLRNCPAPHDGFITKGDNNGLYDQAGRGGAQTGPVKPAWVVGTAEVRIPGLGWVRLATQ
ncbi:S26 family signal peptidase [Salinibaculum rarum]|uniref:S26 family signal peptidase n=1 Tax=Salinibaculum rarum TaxID=3058903 RepID=UPI0034E947EA